MKLRELLAAIPNLNSLPEHPSLEMEIKGLSTNSHACQRGDVFIGMPGTRVDGGEFWPGGHESRGRSRDCFRSGVAEVSGPVGGNV